MTLVEEAECRNEGLDLHFFLFVFSDELVVHHFAALFIEGLAFYVTLEGLELQRDPIHLLVKLLIDYLF